MIPFIACVLLGYMIGCLSYQSDPQVADFIFYKLLPFGISLDRSYVAFQAYQAFKVQLTADQPLILLQTEAQMVYAELLPTLGYDFLSQFDDLELLSFYLQAIDNNIELSLEAFLINASLCISTFLPLPLSNRKQEFFSSIKLKNRVENLFIPKMFEVTFLTSI